MPESRNVASKSALAASFGKAAADYDRAAHLQKLVGNRLIKLGMAQVQLRHTEKISRLVDLGCGTGYFLPELDHQFSPAELMAIDLSAEMLEYARTRMLDKPTGSAIRFIESDAECLSLASMSVDLVYSSLALQWVLDIDRAMSEIRRILKPGGMFAFSTLLDGTLIELKNAWAQVDDGQHVNDFLTLDDYQESLLKNGFEVLVANAETVEIEYPEALGLMRDLKAIGAHNIALGRPRNVTSPGKLKGVVKAYETYRKLNGMLPAHYVTGLFVVRKFEVTEL